MYQTIYKASYGTVKAPFKHAMTLGKAEKMGKDYCEAKNLTYIKTEEC